MGVAVPHTAGHPPRSLLSWFPCPGRGRRQPEEDAADGTGDSERHLQRCQHQIT